MMNIDNFDFQNSTIIKPPTANFDKVDHRKNVNYTRIVIDSRDRDVSQYPNPNSYVIDLPDDIQDVVAAELHVADLTLAAPLVSMFNNSVIFVIGGVVYNVVIESGNYNNGQNLGAIIAANISVSVPSFAGTFDANTEKFVFSCNDAFYIDFSAITSNLKPYLGRILGFAYGQVVNASAVGGSFVLKSQFKINTSDNTYVVLHVDNLYVNKSTTSIIDKSFALLGSKSDSKYSLKPFRKDLNPPIGKLSRIRLKFNDYYGNLYDFQNHDHRLEIVFESYKVLRKYMSYVD